MTRTEMLQWVAAEFAPLTLATPQQTQVQIIENAIRFCNANSAFKVAAMYQASKAIQVSPRFKQVTEVFPAQQADRIFMDNPLFSTLGIVLLDNVTSDLITISESFKAYRNYISTDFRWRFVKSDDPAVGGKIYSQSLPARVTSVCAIGTLRILPAATEDVKFEPVLDWLLRYIKACVKETEGNTLRKAGIIGVANDGGDLVSEGREEKKALEDDLVTRSRWVVAARRI